jgi:hypothetical protein
MELRSSVRMMRKVNMMMKTEMKSL